MTEHTALNSVIVPVGLGGKNTPYVPEPAPTLLVEIALVDAAAEEARLATLAATARQEADAVLAAAQEEARGVRETAEVEAHAILAAAEAAALHRVRELDERDEDLARRERDLEARSGQVEAEAGQLEERESLLEARRVRMEEDERAATAALAAAREDAEAILEEARSTAESMVEAALDEARVEAQAIRDAAREDADSARDEHISDIAAVHRVEVELLHARERELLGRVEELERRLAHATERRPAQDEPAPAPDPLPDLPITSPADGTTEETEQGGRHLGTSETPARTAGAGEPRSTTAGGIAAHAPLTEQLSTSAFRSMSDKERRGRRRR